MCLPTQLGQSTSRTSLSIGYACIVAQPGESALHAGEPGLRKHRHANEEHAELHQHVRRWRGSRGAGRQWASCWVWQWIDTLAAGCRNFSPLCCRLVQGLLEQASRGKETQHTAHTCRPWKLHAGLGGRGRIGLGPLAASAMYQRWKPWSTLKRITPADTPMSSTLAVAKVDEGERCWWIGKEERRC